MNHDARATPSLAPAPDVGVPGGLEAALLAKGQGTVIQAGTGGSAPPADGADVVAVLAERGKRYGRFEQHAHIAQTLKQTMQMTGGWERLSADQKESLEMVQHKVARILNGDPNYADSWVDIAGYAKLVADRLEGVSR
jgi:hypothetical protein